MKTNSTPELTPKKSLRCTLPVGLASLCLLAATIVPASALYIDFEPPTYTSAMELNGQGGWTAGNQNYVVNSTMSGTQSGFVYAGGYGAAQYSLTGSDFGATTTVMTLMQTATPSTFGYDYSILAFYLSNTNSSTYFGALADTDGVFRYLNVGGTEWQNTSLTFSYGDVLSLTATLNFTAQTYDLSVTNLTTTSSIALTSLGFINTTSISEAPGRIVIGGQAAGFDDISVQAVPEPSTNVLLGLAAAGVAVVLTLRRKQAHMA